MRFNSYRDSDRIVPIIIVESGSEGERWFESLASSTFMSETQSMGEMKRQPS